MNRIWHIGCLGWLLMGYLLTVSAGGQAHPMPNSLVALRVYPDRIEADLQLPLSELQFSFGHEVNDRSDRLVERLGPQLRTYLKQHIRPVSPDGRAWTVDITTLSVQATRNPLNGLYKELIARCYLRPPAGSSVRRFTFHYDAILHQLVTHKILVSIRQDWERGLSADQPPVEIGLIEMDVPTATIPPLPVRLAAGSNWKGFQSLVVLGMHHISAGTDHLLFLLVLLLPAPLLAGRRRWLGFGGLRYSVKQVLRVITAFTAGHSLTLLVASVGWIQLPEQPIEVLIALSIFVSAIHARYPLFAGREACIAGGFGLIHGLAFAGSISNLNLDSAQLTLSILAFNLGIELMQVSIVTLTLPWLMLLSRTTTYSYFRLGGALFASGAALAWTIERLSGNTNWLTNYLETPTRPAIGLLLSMAGMALFLTWRQEYVRR